jgi:hypothetical protein
MNTQLLITFIVFNIINVIIQTVKSLATIKCGKTVAAIVNAIAYGLYTYIVVLTVCELPLWLKVAVVGGANLIGVYVVKLIEEKSRKDKLWKIESSVNGTDTKALHRDLQSKAIPHNYIEKVGKYTIFNIYCATQKESAEVKQILNNYDVKYFVSESKAL